MICPKCGSENINTQIIQENRGSHTVTSTYSRYQQRGHGCLWWLFIGWWWWMVDLTLWLVFFPIRLIWRLFSSPYKNKKYTGGSTSTSHTNNQIQYKKVCVCQNCGHNWDFQND